MLFDFNNTPIDDATRVHGMGSAVSAAASAASSASQARTAAERAAASRNAQPNRQQPRQQSANVYRAGSEQPERRPTGEQRQTAEQRQAARRQQEELEEQRSRTVTTAVVICSAIAVIAIIIFLIVLFNGGIFSRDVSTVQVPNLIGQVYKELDYSKYPDMEIVFADFEYSDEYETGEIVDQTPKSGDHVAVGTEVKVWVSMGQEEDDMPVLTDLEGVTEEAATNYLNALDLVPLPRYENSEEIEEGQVIRTEPAAGEQPTRGQTVIIYVSTGPAVVTEKIPDTVIGMDKDRAVTMLNKYGFDNVRAQPQDSTEPQNQVLSLNVETGVDIDVTTEIILYYSSGEMYAQMPGITSANTVEEAKKLLDDLGFKNVDIQEEYNKEILEGKVIKTNIPAGTKVDVKTAIVLTVSLGPEPTEPPTTQPSETTQPAEVTKTVKVSLPTDRTEAYKLTIMLGSGVTVLDDYVIQPGTESITVEMTGSGVMTYEIYIDGEYIRSEKVDFSA